MSLPIVVVLGAGRSGTNFLADVLAHDPGLCNTVENRYIWNYRQKTLKHDVRRPDEVTGPVSSYIRRHFQSIASKTGQVPIDKTPSNVFRVSFVHRVFPKAKLIHIIRDGRDNVYSRIREWHGGNTVVARQHASGLVEVTENFRTAFIRRRFDRLRDLVKSRGLPADRVPTFLYDNASVLARQLFTRELVRYGERFPGMEQHLRAYGSLATCAAQWREGVLHALSEGRRLSGDTYFELRYEDLLARPSEEWARLASFLGVDADSPAREFLMETATRRSEKDWSREEYREFLRPIEPHIRPTLEFLNYAWV